MKSRLLQSLVVLVSLFLVACSASPSQAPTAPSPVKTTLVGPYAVKTQEISPSVSGILSQPYSLSEWALSGPDLYALQPTRYGLRLMKVSLPGGQTKTLAILACAATSTIQSFGSGLFVACLTGGKTDDLYISPTPGRTTLVYTTDVLPRKELWFGLATQGTVFWIVKTSTASGRQSVLASGITPPVGGTKTLPPTLASGEWYQDSSGAVWVWDPSSGALYRWDGREFKSVRSVSSIVNAISPDGTVWGVGPGGVSPSGVPVQALWETAPTAATPVPWKFSPSISSFTLVSPGYLFGNEGTPPPGSFMAIFPLQHRVVDLGALFSGPVGDGRGDVVFKGADKNFYLTTVSAAKGHP